MNFVLTLDHWNSLQRYFRMRLEDDPIPTAEQKQKFKDILDRVDEDEVDLEEAPEVLITDEQVLIEKELHQYCEDSSDLDAYQLDALLRLANEDDERVIALRPKWEKLLQREARS